MNYTWTQLQSTIGLLATLISNFVAYGRFLCLYECLGMRLKSELGHAYGRRLGPAIMFFHVQLTLCNWMICQLDVTQAERIGAPDVYQGLHMLEVQHDITWLPTVTNVPVMLVL
jgi:hypothetical protein